MNYYYWGTKASWKKKQTISLLTTNVWTRRFIGVKREAIEEALKCLQIQTKVLARGSNAMWDTLLLNEEQTKKYGRQHTDNSQYVCKQNTWSLERPEWPYAGGAHGCNREAAGVFFSHFEQVEDASAVFSKAGIATAEFILQITMYRKEFNDITDIPVIVEVWRCHWWFCGGSGYLAKMCPEKNPVPPTTTLIGPAVTKPATPEEAVGREKSGQIPSSFNEWKEVT